MKFLIQFKSIVLALALSISGARAEVMEVWSHSLENGDYARNVKQYDVYDRFWKISALMLNIIWKILTVRRFRI